MQNAQRCSAMLSNAQQFLAMLSNAPDTQKFQEAWDIKKAIPRAASGYARQLKISHWFGF